MKIDFVSTENYGKPSTKHLPGLYPKRRSSLQQGSRNHRLRRQWTVNSIASICVLHQFQCIVRKFCCFPPFQPNRHFSFDTLGNSKSVRFLNGYFTPKKDPISLAYNGTLLAFYFTFTVFSNQSVAGSACQAVAAIAYCLLLS